LDRADGTLSVRPECETEKIGSNRILFQDGSMNVLQPVAYAHSKQGLSKERWHALEDHLQGTAQRASDFAGKFGSAIWGWYAGLWHDLGKFAPDWQSSGELRTS